MSNSKPSSGFVGCLFGCSNTFKVISVILNGLLAFIGATIVLFGGLALCNDVTYQLITTLNAFMNFRQCYGVIVITGFFLCLLGTFGVISTVQGLHKRLSIPIVLYLLVIILTVIILMLTWSDKKINLDSNINNAIRNYQKQELATNLDSLQTLIGCCGTKGAADFEIRNGDMFSKDQTPLSCCSSGQECPSGGANMSSVAKAYSVGCSTRIEGLVWPVMYGICASLDGLMFLAVLIMILTVFSHEGSPCLGSNDPETGENEEEGNEDEKVALAGAGDDGDQEEEEPVDEGSQDDGEVAEDIKEEDEEEEDTNADGDKENNDKK